MAIFDVNDELYNAAKIAVTEVLGLKKDEGLLIITNPLQDVSDISRALYKAAQDVGSRPVLIYQEKKNQLDFAEDAVLGSLSKAPPAIISMSAGKLGKDRFSLEKPYELEGKKYDHIFNYLLRGKKEIRSFWSPGVTRDIFVRTVPIDYARLRKEAHTVKEILDKADGVCITAPGGSDFYIGLKGRAASLDDGEFSKPGSGGNMPCGETHISPELGASRGIIVFDGSISLHDGDIVLKNPITCEVEKGFVTDISGGEEAKKLRETIDLSVQNARKMAQEGKLPETTMKEYIKNGTNLGELGIGLNPKAKITGNMLEDEKAYHTCHVAIGTNYEGDASALIHLDGLIRDPTMTAIYPDGEELMFMKEGTLKLEME